METHACLLYAKKKKFVAFTSTLFNSTSHKNCSAQNIHIVIFYSVNDKKKDKA